MPVNIRTRLFQNKTKGEINLKDPCAGRRNDSSYLKPSFGGPPMSLAKAASAWLGVFSISATCVCVSNVLTGTAPKRGEGDQDLRSWVGRSPRRFRQGELIFERIIGDSLERKQEDLENEVRTDSELLAKNAI